MRNRFLTLGAVILLGWTPVPGVAQDLGSICENLQQQEVGGWAQYELTGQTNGDMRLALLSEGAGGAEGQWFEMAGKFNGQDAIVQILADEWPFEADDIRGVVMKAAGQPAMRLPESMLSQMRGQMNSPVGSMAEFCAQGELLGSETVEVPAGSFKTHKIKPGGTVQGMPDTVWVATDVSFGVVKSVGPDGTMVLLDQGRGATSSISEAPRTIPGMP